MRVRSACGYEWAAREGTDDHLAWGGHETGLIAIAQGLLPQGGVFLDVGAHVGSYAIRLAGQASYVIALEAASDTFEGLSLNVALNFDHGGEKITCLPFAAWDHEAVLYASRMAVMDEQHTVRDRHGSDGSTHLTYAAEQADSSVSPVKAFTIDFLLAAFDPVLSLVKIDVEGAEYRVLKGMEQRILSDRPVLLIEMHDRLLSVDEGKLLVSQIDAFLDKHQYVKSNPLEAGAGYHIICTPEERS